MIPVSMVSPILASFTAIIIFFEPQFSADDFGIVSIALHWTLRKSDFEYYVDEDEEEDEEFDLSDLPEGTRLATDFVVEQRVRCKTNHKSAGVVTEVLPNRVNIYVEEYRLCIGFTENTVEGY